MPETNTACRETINDNFAKEYNEYCRKNKVCQTPQVIFKCKFNEKTIVDKYR